MPTSVSLREDDPLLKDLSEKKQSFRRNVVSLATELKEARTRLAEQERSCSQETLSRQASKQALLILLAITFQFLVLMLSLIWRCFVHVQEAETRAKRMEDEMLQLGMELNKKVEQIRASDVEQPLTLSHSSEAFA